MTLRKARFTTNIVSHHKSGIFPVLFWQKIWTSRYGRGLANKKGYFGIIWCMSIRIYYRVHDMLSRTFRIRIYELLQQYFSVEKRKQIPCWSKKKAFFLSLDYLRKYITCSWHQKKRKPRILQFTNLKYCKKAREPFRTPF